MLLGLAAPSAGHALVFGKAFAELNRPASRVGAVLDSTDLHPGRSGRSHLRFLAAVARVAPLRVDEVLALVDLAGAADRRVAGYSLGMRQRLSLAAALLGDPELLILDEPANGLDPGGMHWLRNFLREFAAQGKTVFVSSHHLAEVAQMVDHVVIIDHGRLVTHSPLSDLTARVTGTVRVLTPEPDKLHAALRRAGITSEHEDGALHVRSARRERIGEIALASGISLSELADETPSLEDIFLQLTARQERPTMRNQLHSELLKLSTTRTVSLIGLAAAALTLLGVLVTGISPTLQELALESNQRTMLGAGSVSGFFATLAGLMIVTAEFRYGTIRPTLLFEPRRRLVLAAKVAGGALIGVALGVVCLALSFAVGFTILEARGVSIALSTGDLLALAFGSIAASAIGGVTGVAVGGLVRSQVGAIVAVVLYAFLVDAILFAAVPSVGRFLPGKAADALAGRGVDHLLAPGAGAAVLLGWTLAFLAAASVRTDHSDI